MVHFIQRSCYLLHYKTLAGIAPEFYTHFHRAGNQIKTAKLIEYWVKQSIKKSSFSNRLPLLRIRNRFFLF